MLTSFLISYDVGMSSADLQGENYGLLFSITASITLRYFRKLDCLFFSKTFKWINDFSVLYHCFNITWRPYPANSVEWVEGAQVYQDLLMILAEIP